MRPDGPALKTWRVTVTDGVTEEVHTVLSAARAIRELADLDADAQG